MIGFRWEVFLPHQAELGGIARHLGELANQMGRAEYGSVPHRLGNAIASMNQSTSSSLSPSSAAALADRIGATIEVYRSADRTVTSIFR